MATTRYGSTKRFGARYGRRVKEKVGKVEQARRASKSCPYCNKPKVKRLAAGIWECGKCSNKFTGKAYVIGAAPVLARQEAILADDELAEVPAEDEDDKEEPEEAMA